MTEKPVSKGWERAQRIQAEQRERVAELTKALLAMRRPRQLDVLLAVLDAARVGCEKTPLPGLYEAAATAAAALLVGELAVIDGHRDSDGLPHQDALENRLNREHNAMAERLAAVGHGARLQVKNQTIVNEVREIAPWLDAALGGKLDADTLARALSTRFARPVNVAAVQRGLSARRHSGRVTWVVLAAGVIPDRDVVAALREPGGAEFTLALDAVREALKIKDLPDHAARSRRPEDKIRTTPGSRMGTKWDKKQKTQIVAKRRALSPPRSARADPGSHATGALQPTTNANKSRHKGTRTAHKGARRS